MKKNYLYVLMSAIALTGTMGIISCSSEDDVIAKVEDNPTYDPIKGELTAQFVLNVSAAATTRQSSAAVQKNNNFRGLKDAKLIGLSTGKSAWMAPFAGNSSEYAVKKTYDLGTLYAEGSVNNSTGTNSSSSSNRILRLNLPLQTDAMLVYARAIGGKAADGTNTDEGNGKVAITMDATPENITFDLVSRIGNRETEYNETCNLAALIMNRILKSEVAATASYSYEGHSNEGALPALSWRGIGASLKSNASLPPLQENLAAVYNAMTTLRTNEVRGGSASAVCNMIYNAYQTVQNVLAATPTTDGELNAQRLAETIKDRIDNYFNVAATEAATTFRGIGDKDTEHTIINGLVKVSEALTLEQYNTQFSHVQHGDLIGFPTSFNLPFGSAQLIWTDFNAEATTGGFSYKNPSTSLLDLGATISPSHYMYPSELLYFNNSSLYVSDAEKLVSDYPNGYTTWDNYGWSTNGWTNSGVVSTTRSVAVKNNINYGVAMLQTKVALDGSSFFDNRHAIVTSEADQELNDGDLSLMTLTGVIIGGQNHQVGWNYLATANETTDWDYAIFDNQISNGTIPTGAGNENYTLVFDNYHADAQQNVMVALEFQNGSNKDFYGKGNLIRKGGKFYLIGKLNLSDATNAVTWPTNYPIPPYVASGENAGKSQQVTRVFIQDYLTTATFKIGANSLKNAFVTVPDLRSTQASLGLSVDLNWRTGLSFETTLGGE